MCVLQGLTWRCSVCCVQSASRPRRPCSSTWRSTQGCTATSVATASAPSPATRHSRDTCARTRVRDGAWCQTHAYFWIGDDSCIYLCIWVHFLRFLASRFLDNLRASSPAPSFHMRWLTSLMTALSRYGRRIFWAISSCLYFGFFDSLWASAIHGCQFSCGSPNVREETQISIEGKANGNDLSVFLRGRVSVPQETERCPPFFLYLK